MSSATANHRARTRRSYFALWNLILKDFRVRYRNMALGFLWSLINPLVMMLVLTFTFTRVMPQPDRPFFHIFLLIGLILYTNFSLSLTLATVCIVENTTLIKKLSFPRQFIPISVVLSQAIHIFIQLGLLAVFIALFRVPVTATYLWLPLICAVQIAFILGLAFVCSTLNVFYRDVQYLVASVATIMFWFTPIAYSMSMVRSSGGPVLYRLCLFNPLAGCIEAGRRAILENAHPDPLGFGLAAALSLLLLLIGYKVFTRNERNFADYV